MRIKCFAWRSAPFSKPQRLLGSSSTPADPPLHTQTPHHPSITPPLPLHCRVTSPRLCGRRRTRRASGAAGCAGWRPAPEGPPDDATPHTPTPPQTQRHSQYRTKRMSPDKPHKTTPVGRTEAWRKDELTLLILSSRFFALFAGSGDGPPSCGWVGPWEELAAAVSRSCRSCTNRAFSACTTTRQPVNAPPTWAIIASPHIITLRHQIQHNTLHEGGPTAHSRSCASTASTPLSSHHSTPSSSSSSSPPPCPAALAPPPST